MTRYALFLLLASSPASAALVAPPSCTSQFGQPVQFVPLSKADFEAFGARYNAQFILAAALPNPVRPVVLLDRDTLAGTPPEFQRQVLLHECAHISHGLRGSPEEEKAADCEAAKRLKTEFGAGRKELESILAVTRRVLKAEDIEEPLIMGKLNDVAACFDSALK